MNEIDSTEQFLDHVVLSDAATFHASGHVHKDNVRIWAHECSHIFTEHGA